MDPIWLGWQSIGVYLHGYIRAPCPPFVKDSPDGAAMIELIKMDGWMDMTGEADRMNLETDSKGEVMHAYSLPEIAFLEKTGTNPYS